MEISGVVQTIIFRNSENGWTVLELLDDEGHRVAAVGSLPLVNAGERVKLIGNFVSHPRYGQQFKADKAEFLAPASLQAVESYLGSGLIKGIGPSTAKAIVLHFGMETLTILDETPERLCEIPGIGKKRFATIAASYRENRMMRDIMLALEPYGVTVNQALKLYRIYGELCMARIQENPYQIIADVDGIGFGIADKIAQNVEGFSYESSSRLKAGLLHAMQQARNEYGHTYLPEDSLLRYAEKLLGVPTEPIRDALDLLLSDCELLCQQIGEINGIFLPKLMRMETNIAQKLIKLSEKPIDNPLLREHVNLQQGKLELSGQQREAIELAIREGALVITGGPGTGKTTIIRYITEMMTGLSLEVALCAPTGRAAKRMSEATGHEAKTLHRLLEYIPNEGFLRNSDNPLFYDMIIVDEMSMVDVPLMHALLNAIPAGTRLIMVGDSDQLPSVGAGDVLRDILKSQVIRSIRLTEIFRQAQKSMIVTNAHRINAGSMPILDRPDSDFRFESYASADQLLSRILQLVNEPGVLLSTTEPLMDIQVLAPMKKGSLGVINLNFELQAVLNPPASDKRQFVSGETTYREGDRVMQIKNNYKIEWKKQEKGETSEGTGVYNGDLGTIYRIEHGSKRFMILFDDERLATYDFSAVEEIDLAYCISIHKSQGSEFPIVILPLFGAASPLLTRNLLYTAVTRAKRQVICLGRESILQRMVENNQTTRRYTALGERLKEWAYLHG